MITLEAIGCVSPNLVPSNGFGFVGALVWYLGAIRRVRAMCAVKAGYNSSLAPVVP
jgi:hypothetical protein